MISQLSHLDTSELSILDLQSDMDMLSMSEPRSQSVCSSFGISIGSSLPSTAPGMEKISKRRKSLKLRSLSIKARSWRSAFWR